MASSQKTPVLELEDIEYLIAFLRTTNEPVATSVLVETLLNRQA